MNDKICLGIHIGHDRGAAITKNGLLIGQLSEERLDRVKHSNSPELPKRAISKLLEWHRIGIKQITAVGISYTNVNIDSIIEELSDEICDFLGVNVPVHGFSHHLCHAYSTFYTSPFESSAILVADGAGDISGSQIEAESMYYAENGNIKTLATRYQDFGLSRTARRNSYSPSYIHPEDRSKEISLGRKYEQFTYLIGFKHGEAGKTMGLASFSAPLFEIEPPKFNSLDFSLTFSSYIDEIKEYSKGSPLPWHNFLKKYSSDIASVGQEVIEKYVLRVAQNLHEMTKSSNLSLAGGVFLNCLLNHKILEQTPFEKVHIIPAAGDDGQCVGAALLSHCKEFGPPVSSDSTLPYLGISYGEDEILERLGYFKLNYTTLNDDDLVDRLAQVLTEHKIIGILRGRSELGPRALGHRSILANPSDVNLKDKLNLLKGRELFRPFAPIVTREEEDNYFDLKQKSPYMLLAGHVRPEFRDQLPAITHVDGTARVQSVSYPSEPFLHDLLNSFKKQSGCGVLLNTSFNLAGDPIVESPNDAISTFLSSELDCLVMENYFITKKVE